MTHFFVSYAKKDTRDTALALTDALNALDGVTAWVDRSLRAGKNWELQIQAEIDRCDYMVVLYSPDINRHKRGEEESYVLTEIAYARYTAKRPIIPVMAQKTEPPMSLTTAHYIDYTLPCLRLDDLVNAICAEAEITTGAVSVSRPISLSLMPAPFAWIEIPKKGYSIAKYPVTNAQFAKFIEAGGYKIEHWWTDAGREARIESGWIQPRYWTDSKWNGAEQPVVGVSWYEAVAFCLWLSDVTGEKIMLPTEDQWQYAAQGDDGRAYPWGNDWDCERCNNSVEPCASNVTTPVQQYEGKSKGDSPFGVVDMAGNVWEWCLTDYDDRTNDMNSDATDRVLRGGSWGNHRKNGFQCHNRSKFFPRGWYYVRGFRISRS